MPRVRSPNYPAISLPEAITRAKTIHEAEQHLAAPKEVIAKHLGFGGLNGVSNRIISALTKYGLLEEVSGDKVKVSPLAISILHPTSPAEKASAIKDAASKPSLFSEITSEWNGAQPSDANLRTYLIRRNFASDALDRVIQAYRDTMELVTSTEGGYNKPASHSDGTPPVANVGEQAPIQPKGPEPASAQRLPSPPSPQAGEESLPFHVAIAAGGLEIAARIKNEGDVENLIQILQTMKPLLQNIYRRQSAPLADRAESVDIGDHAQRVFETSMMGHKEAGTGVSFIITQAQKDELRQRGYTDEQIREMKPEDAHRALGLIN
jgi:hypothetical protein